MGCPGKWNQRLRPAVFPSPGGAKFGLPAPGAGGLPAQRATAPGEFFAAYRRPPKSGRTKDHAKPRGRVWVWVWGGVGWGEEKGEDLRGERQLGETGGKGLNREKWRVERCQDRDPENW